jgi:hypothetical protein
LIALVGLTALVALAAGLVAAAELVLAFGIVVVALVAGHVSLLVKKLIAKVEERAAFALHCSKIASRGEKNGRQRRHPK